MSCTTDAVDPPTCPVCDFGFYFGHCSGCGYDETSDCPVCDRPGGSDSCISCGWGIEGCLIPEARFLAEYGQGRS